MVMWNRLKFQNTNLVSWNTKKFPKTSEIGPILMLVKTQKKKNLTLQILTKKLNVDNFDSQGTLDADSDEWN